jgi:O6-methylguanine-DNA--protein-cysteine methyltransferase
VVAAGGGIGGYTGGLDIKRELMRIEGISLEKEES